ncbi:MAG: hypothetical protein OIF50_14020 [Flavobacteriaceae bacterium]|nr:hypothetical protein [Flavobacteriaceae bacterium]
MKCKLGVLSVLMLLSFGLQGQNKARTELPWQDKRHEVSFNMGMMLLNKSIGFQYEYFLNNDTSVGGGIYFNDDAQKDSGSFGLHGSFRAYFGGHRRSGFFAEGYGMFYQGKESGSNQTDFVLRLPRSYETFAFGLGVGNKWTVRSERMTFEIFGGVGRNLSKLDYVPNFSYRLGASIGFRL